MGLLGGVAFRGCANSTMGQRGEFLNPGAGKWIRGISSGFPHDPLLERIHGTAGRLSNGTEQGYVTY